MPKKRIAQRFAKLKQENRAGLVTFITAGDPDYDSSLSLLKALPAAGADLIELGMPFSDPMADGPAIQASNIRALKAGMTLIRCLDMVREFRKDDTETPLILMGYYNPIYIYGVDRFLAAALAAGVDGLIIVDLPPEEDSELAIPAKKAGMDYIPLATPTTNKARLGRILEQASGFVYYVSIAGITGTRRPDMAPVKTAIDMIHAETDLPVAVGFGISTPDDVRRFAGFADAVVVGSAIVNIIADNVTAAGHANSLLQDSVLDFVGTLGHAVRASEETK